MLPSHQRQGNLMSHLDKIEAARQRRLEAEEDERIKRVEQLTGGAGTVVCKVCHMNKEVFGHADSCELRRINPDAIEQQIDENIKLHRKNANKQRIFKGERKPTWSGVPGKQQKSLVRRRSSKNRGPNRELRYCAVCEERTMFVNQRCRTCEHERPCNYYPTGKNCQSCFPGE